MTQTAEQAMLKSSGCILCHKNVGDPHFKETLHIGCCDCHGGDPASPNKEERMSIRVTRGLATSANPVRAPIHCSTTSAGVRPFCQPGDLRIAHPSCGTAGCHPKKCWRTARA